MATVTDANDPCVCACVVMLFYVEVTELAFSTGQPATFRTNTATAKISRPLSCSSQPSSAKCSLLLTWWQTCRIASSQPIQLVALTWRAYAM